MSVKAIQKSYVQSEALCFYRENINEGLSAEEIQFTQAYFQINQSILLIGAGGGREVAALKDQGFQLFGVDLSLEMTQITQSVKGAHLSVASAVSLPFKNKCFDHVWFSDSVYCQIPGRENRQKALKGAMALLKPDGFLTVDCRPLTSEITSSPLWKTVPGAVVHRLRVLKQWLLGNFSAREAGDTEIVENGVKKFYHFFRSPKEIEQEFQAAGFKVVECLSGLWILKYLK